VNLLSKRGIFTVEIFIRDKTIQPLAIRQHSLHLVYLGVENVHDRRVDSVNGREIARVRGP
jgi:hypothetical protein